MFIKRWTSLRYTILFPKQSHTLYVVFKKRWFIWTSTKVAKETRKTTSAWDYTFLVAQMWIYLLFRLCLLIFVLKAFEKRSSSVQDNFKAVIHNLSHSSPPMHMRRRCELCMLRVLVVAFHLCHIVLKGFFYNHVQRSLSCTCHYRTAQFQLLCSASKSSNQTA